jgi:hypothetical protein
MVVFEHPEEFWRRVVALHAAPMPRALIASKGEPIRRP